MHKSGKLKTAGFSGRNSASTKQTVPESIHVRCSAMDDTSLVIDGEVNSVRCKILIDTGATRSVIRNGIIKSGLYTGRCFSIITATGEKVMALGEIIASFKFGEVVYEQNVLVADIVEECIIGMDFLISHRAKLDIYERTLGLGAQQILMEPKQGLYSQGLYSQEDDLNFPKISSCLTASEIQRVQQFIKEFHHILICKQGLNGRTHEVEHQINTGNAVPIRQRPRRLPLAQEEEVEKMIQTMKKEDVIEESCSPWSSPVVLVQKKDGTKRFCVDYRMLNSVTKKDSYPLPRIDDTLDVLSGSTWFSTLDLKSGYWQVGLANGAKEKTAFSAGAGLWQFKVLPFGLCNAPATFERLMERVLKGILFKTCLVYLDDIIVFGPSFDEHLIRLKEVLTRLKQAGLQLNPKKCQLFQSRVEYLGHIVSSAGIETDPKKIDAVKTWPTPSNKRELRSFLGLCTYYRRFVKNFADIACNLHVLTEKNRQFQWTTENETSFQELKTRLCEAPVLAYPIPGELFILDTDASNDGIGGILSQRINQDEKVLAYYSRKFNKAERNYCVTRRELLAMVETMKHFGKYLIGKRFLIRTDHAALKWLTNFKNPEGQIARWLERLQSFEFVIEHRKGLKHGNADALSRRPCGELCSHCLKTEANDSPALLENLRVHSEPRWANEEIKKQQKDDPTLRIVMEWLEQERRPEWKEISNLNQDLKYYWAQWGSLTLTRGLLYRTWESSNGQNNLSQLILPYKLQKEVLSEVHSGVSGGHLGVNKTLQKIRKKFYWVKCKEDVTKWIQRCQVCAACKGPAKRTRAAMKVYNVGSPFERIAMDITGPFPTSTNGNKYMLVVIDYFTKWPEVYAIQNQEAVTVADALIQNWISRFGVPMELHTDQGRNFESQVFQEVCQTLKINKTRTTPMRPQSDGMVERFNRTIKEHLAKVISSDQKDWERHIPLFLMAYRSAVHESTAYPPAEVLFGSNIRLPSDITFGATPNLDAVGVTEYVADLKNRLNEIHETARVKMNLYSERMKTRYDVRAAAPGFVEGQKVWLYNPQRKKGISSKLTMSWEGPYVVIKKINDVVYRIRRRPNGRFKVVHTDRLAEFRSDRDDLV